VAFRPRSRCASIAKGLRVPMRSGVTGVFAALGWRRLRLRLDQQVEAWTGGERQHRTVASKRSPLGVWLEARRSRMKSSGWGTKIRT